MRNWSNLSPRAKTTGSITDSATSVTIDKDPVVATPFTAVLTPDPAKTAEEVVLVTAVVNNGNGTWTCTIVRAFGGSTAKAHSSGAVFQAVYIDKDFLLSRKVEHLARSLPTVIDPRRVDYPVYSAGVASYLDVAEGGEGDLVYTRATTETYTDEDSVLRTVEPHAVALFGNGWRYDAATDVYVYGAGAKRNDPYLYLFGNDRSELTFTQKFNHIEGFTLQVKLDPVDSAAPLADELMFSVGQDDVVEAGKPRLILDQQTSGTYRLRFDEGGGIYKTITLTGITAGQINTIHAVVDPAGSLRAWVNGKELTSVAIVLPTNGPEWVGNMIVAKNAKQKLYHALVVTGVFEDPDIVETLFQ